MYIHIHTYLFITYMSPRSIGEAFPASLREIQVLTGPMAWSGSIHFMEANSIIVYHKMKV